MAISLYDISVASYLQLLGGVAGFLEKGKVHFSENGSDLGEIVQTRLYPDMLPFHFQIVSVAHHSLGAIKGLQAGSFSPPGGGEDLDYQGLQALVTDAREQLESFKSEDINAMEGGEMVFKMGDLEIPFTAENFIMSFSLPNFYFHATTAYDILRMKGVPVGKRDFTGRLRIKR